VTIIVASTSVPLFQVSVGGPSQEFVLRFCRHPPMIVASLIRATIIVQPSG